MHWLLRCCGRRHRTAGALFTVCLLAFCLQSVAPRRVWGGRLARYGGSLHVALPLRPADLAPPEPLTLWGDDGALVSACLYEGLTRWGSGGLEPDLAVHWVRNDEGTRWYFQLRPEIRFHDGTRCDAQSVSESLHRLADPRRSPHAWLLRELVGMQDYVAGETQQIEGIYVLSSTELELQCDTPVPDLAARLALPEAAIVRGQGTAALGTGPFRLVSAVAETLRCAAFEQHHEGRPFLNAVTFTGIARDATRPREAALLRKLDPAAAPPAGAVRVRVPARRLALALLHPKSAVFADAALRRRVAATFDAAVFVRAGLAGDGEPAFGLSPQAATVRATPPAVQESKSPPRHPVKILVPAAEPVLVKLGERLQVQLAQLSLDAEVDSRPPATYTTALRAGAFDLAVLGWTPPAEDLQETGRVLHLLSTLLLPVLGDGMPPAWRDLLEGRGRATEVALGASGHLLPLVFFHDVWQAPDTVQPLRPAPETATLGLPDAHVRPVIP